jgi:hypothetical protein
VLAVNRAVNLVETRRGTKVLQSSSGFTTAQIRLL